MKSVGRLLSLLICFELILGSIDLRLANLAHAQSTDCSHLPGTEFNTRSGTCKATEESARARNERDKCMEHRSITQRNECLRQNADTARTEIIGDEEELRTFGDLGGRGGIESGPLTGNQSVTDIVGQVNAGASVVAIPILLLLMGLSKRGFEGCHPESMLLILGGATATIAAEVTSFIMHGLRLEEMRKKMDELTNPEGTNSRTTDDGTTSDQRVDANEVQSGAFNLLAENERSLAIVAKTKAGIYALALGLYGAAAIFGIKEQIELEGLRLTAATSLDPLLRLASLKRINELTCYSSAQAEKAEEEEAKEIEKTSAAAPPAATAPAAAAPPAAPAPAAPAPAPAAPTPTPTPTPAPAPDAPATAPAPSGALKPIIEEPTPTAPRFGDEDGGLRNDGVFVPEDHKLFIKSLSFHKEKTTPTSGILIKENLETKGSHKNYSRFIHNKKNNDSLISIYKNTYHSEIEILKSTKYQKAAAKNLGSANDAHDFVELLNEFKTIGLTDKSSTLFEESSLVTEYLKNLQIEKNIFRFVASMIMPIAYAADPNEIVAPLRGADERLKELLDTLFKKDQVGGAAAKAEGESTASEIIFQPYTRAAGASLLTVWSSVMAGYLYHQSVISDARAVQLDLMAEQSKVGVGIGTCTPEQRNSSAFPNCFCFTEELTINPARSGSEVCSDLFRPGGGNINTTPDTASSTRTCVDQNRGVDPKCECRTKRGANGKNTCLKLTPGGRNFGGDVGTFKTIGNTAQTANSIFNGTTSPAGLDVGALGAQALRLRNTRDKLISKNPKLAKLVSSTKKKFENKLLKSTAGLSSLQQGGGGSLAKLNPQQAIAELKKEIEKNKDNIQKNQSSTGGSLSSPKAEQPEFGMTTDDLATQDLEVAKAMKDKLDYGQNDINKNNSNIFEVLTNRYQRSGMRRLFDEDGKTKADKASNTDINK